MNFEQYVGVWFFDAEGNQAMFSNAGAVEEHYNNGWRLSRDEAMELAMKHKLDKERMAKVRAAKASTKGEADDS